MISNKKPNDLQLAPDDPRMTRQEARDILHALDKPEFSGLMDNYINEISDPNNIKETNQFLKESEEKKDLPSNVRLAKPTPGFCIRSEKYSIKHPSNRQKVFINICSYNEIAEPTCNDNNMWSLPHLLNKGRHDQDKHKKMCTTFDVVFNEKAIELSKKDLRFKKFVCDTAIDGINKQILKSEEEKISNDYVVKKFNYKGLEVSYINVHTLNKGEMDDRKEPSEFHKTELMKEVEKLKQEKKEEEKKNDLYDQPDIESNIDKINENVNIQKQIDINNKEPVYKIKYSDNFELKNYFYNPEGMDDESLSIKYKNMIISINTPLMNTINDAELEIDVKKLKFKYQDIYELNLNLPMEIKKETVQAKYDKNKKILNVTVEIKHKQIEMPKRKEDDQMEIINEEEERLKEEEERKKKKEEEERKIKEEEEKKKKEEEEKKKKEEEERKKKEEEEKKKKEEEEKKKKEEEEKKKKEEEVLIKGQKKEIPKDQPLKEVKYKIEENKKENENEKKVLVEEINTSSNQNQTNNNDSKIKENSTSNEISTKPQKLDEDDTPNITKENILKPSSNEESKTPIVFLNFNSDWIYELD